MRKWMTGIVRYTKQTESGSFKRVNENYLITADNFTEGEAFMTEKMQEYTSGEFEVTKLMRENVEDVIETDRLDYWYKCKVGMQDPESEEIKFINYNYYISSDSVKNATQSLLEYLGKDSVVDYEIKGVTVTNIVDVWVKRFKHPGGIPVTLVDLPPYVRPEEYMKASFIPRDELVGSVVS